MQVSVYLVVIVIRMRCNGQQMNVVMERGFYMSLLLISDMTSSPVLSLLKFRTFSFNEEIPLLQSMYVSLHIAAVILIAAGNRFTVKCVLMCNAYAGTCFPRM